MISATITPISLVLSLVLALPLAAQAARLRPFAALGLETVYTVDGSQFTPGYVGQLGVAWRPAVGRWGARLLLSGQQRRHEFDLESNRSRIYGASLQATLGLGSPTHRLNPYLVAGVGGYRTETFERRVVPCGPGPCPAVLRFSERTLAAAALGLTGGVGLEFALGRVHLQAEAAFTRLTRSRAEPHVLPITLGVRF
jgi:opacity protein-like surface antigen